MSIFLKYKDLSNEATAILSYFKYKKIIYLKEELSHDGYDEFGPESNLWDLYIIIESNNDYKFYHYHWEDWFIDDNDKYRLYQPNIKLSKTNKDNIGYFEKNTQDIKFEKAFQEQSKKIEQSIDDI